MPDSAAPVESLQVQTFTIPTEEPESDGTLVWDTTTCVVVRVHAGGRAGLGYAYAHSAAARVIEDTLAEVVVGQDAASVTGTWQRMVAAVRNTGRPGIASSAISAVDTGLWDLAARLVDLPLVDLLGGVRPDVPVYASGGFTSYPVDRMARQAEAWVAEGHRRAKMKVGREPEEDPARVAAVREAAPDLELFVDANGAFSPSRARSAADRYAAAGVTWFEEPVSSDDLDGLAMVRRRSPAGLDITAGEYGYDPYYFRRMLEAGAVDVLMPDATRCGGFTGFLRAAALAEAFHIPISAHTAPSLHLHVAAAVPGLRHIEWFHDHVLAERLLFEGMVEPVDGSLTPDRSRSGMGLELRPSAARHQAA